MNADTLDDVMRADLMLADYAQVHQGKLFIAGAGINLMAMTPSPTVPYVITFGLGATITVPWNATNQPHQMRIWLVDSDGQVVPLGSPAPGVVVPEADKGVILGNFNMGRSATMEAGEDSIVALAFQFNNLPIPHPGSYKITMRIDNADVAWARFRAVMPQAPMMFGGPVIPAA